MTEEYINKKNLPFSYTQSLREQVPDITTRTGTWVQIAGNTPGTVKWKCSSCGKETDLPNYEKADFCFNCGTKMKEAI